MRTRPGQVLPVEVRYDDYTEDILENRLLLAAIHRLQRTRVRGTKLRRSLRAYEQALSQVTLERFGRPVPEVTFTRLNDRYRPAVALSRLILEGSALEASVGRSIGTAVVLNMNLVFETFVHVALQEQLRLSDRAWPRGGVRNTVHLDHDEAIRVRPDLSWWEGTHCRFVGDVKYKRTDDAINHPDLYQALAYAVSTGLPSATLIYAAGEAEPTSHRIQLVDKQIHVRILDVSGRPDQVLAGIARLAKDIHTLADGSAAA
jgi:5-methylcytosine-specific restriction enzyme subunit McrC